MALGTYNTDGTNQTPKEYYAGTEKGNYQFISVTDIINNFIVSQVGDDKIIKSVKRAEVAFHAQTCAPSLTKMSLDPFTTKECSSWPSSLICALARSAVAMTEIEIMAVFF